MSIYVDPLVNYGWKLGPSCHMTADTVEELLAFAVKIGLKPAWFQKAVEDYDIPHFDLVGSKRELAVLRGAIELGWTDAANQHESIRRKPLFP